MSEEEMLKRKYTRPYEKKIEELEKGKKALFQYLLDLEKLYQDEKKKNAELKAFVNAPLTKGRKTTRRDYIKTVWDLSARLTKAKEILAKLLEEEKNNMYWEMNGADKSSYYEVRKQAEQFLKEIEK